MTETTSLPGFPMARTCPYQPPPGYAALRAAGPITKVSLFDGRTVWVVTGFSEARRLFTDSRLSVDRSDPDYPRLAHSPVDPAAMKAVRTFVDMDEPEHGAHRRLVIGSFTVRRMRSLRTHVDREVETLLDRLIEAGPSADLFTALAVPLSAAVFARLLGIPCEQREFFDERMRLAAHRETSGRALWEIQEAFDRRIDRLAESTGDGVFGSLVAGPLRTGALTRRQLLDLVMVLLVSGHENTINQIGLSLLTLLEHPSELAVLRADPTAVPGAVEELLRYLSIADTVPRLAVADIEIAGELIQAGDGVILPVAAANREETAFPDPDRFDVRRSARHHLAFGHGVHQCLGQHLVRQVLESVISGVVARVPDLRLAVPIEEIPVRGAIGVQGISALPVTWNGVER